MIGMPAAVITAAVVWLGSSAVLRAEDPPGQAGDWLHHVWQTDEGLPDNTILGISETPDGYLWIATTAGLHRFNGSSFLRFPLHDRHRQPTNLIRSSFTDRAGALWLVAEQTLGLENEIGRVIRMNRDHLSELTTPQALGSPFATSMAEDAEGSLWLCLSLGITRITADRQTSRLSDEGMITIDEAWINSDGQGRIWYARGGELGLVLPGGLDPRHRLPSSPVRFCGADDGGLWIAAGSGLFLLEEGQATPAKVADLPPGCRPSVLRRDSSGALWIGTATHGLLRHHRGATHPVVTSHREITCLTDDRRGNLWAGTTGGGINLVRPRAITLATGDYGLPFDSLRSVTALPDGELWVTTQNGLVARRGGSSWIRLGPDHGWPDLTATCLAAHPSGSIWIGTRESGIFEWNAGVWREWGQAEGLIGRSARSILHTRSGDTWIATDAPRLIFRIRNGEVTRFPPVPEMRFIRAMAEGPDGTVWIGAASGHVLRSHQDRLVPEERITEPPPSSVRSLHCTPDGTLWIGFAGRGLGRLAADGSYSLISTTQGLADDFIAQIRHDDQGKLWITGNRGLSSVPIRQIEAVVADRSRFVNPVVYRRSEGLAGIQPTFDYAPTAAIGPDRRIHFATRNGLLSVLPGAVHPPGPPPPIVVESVAIDGETVAVLDRRAWPDSAALIDLVDPAAVIAVPPGHRQIDFSFAALGFSDADNTRFRYRLDGHDRVWVETSSASAAAYPGLPAGRYTFRVSAARPGGPWNHPPATVALIVPPFFWQTWWFRSSAVIAFTGSLVVSVRYLSFRRLRERMRALRQQAALDRERARIARDMHDEVGAKLTRLSLLSDMAAGRGMLPPQATERVREISDTARETIVAFEEIVWAVNPRNDTLNDLIHYLCRHAELFFEGTSTECSFDLPPALRDRSLHTETRHQLFLAAKEAINNILKHASASRARITMRVESDSFVLIIADDGCGFDPARAPDRAGGGNGLANMRDRLRLIHGSVMFQSGPAAGTTITFVVPIGPSGAEPPEP